MNARPRSIRCGIPPSRQHGAATLVVVMILFFIMAMMAAYANRNLVFEQRIASNYYRSGVALEAADAGAEWSLAMLNGIKVDTTCQADSTAASSFRERSFSVDPGSRLISLSSSSVVVAACVRVPDATPPWTCSCPATLPATAPAVSAATTVMQPSFQVQFKYVGGAPPGVPGIVSIVSTGCTASDPAACGGGYAQTTAAAQSQIGSSNVFVQAALASALKAPPSAPLTAGQTVIDSASHLGLHNTDPKGSGLLLVSGAAVSPGVLDSARMESLPGTPAQQAMLTGDSRLATAAASTDAMFSNFFGMSRAQYQYQPAIRNATADNLADTVAAGARLIWGGTSLNLATSGTIGTPSQPVMIVVDGPVTISSSVTINGVIYASGDITVNAPQVIVNGALVSRGTVTVSSGVTDVYYQSAIINIITNTMGSFVKVPGSWFEGQSS